MKEFNGLLKSEIKKINSFASKHNGVDCEITGYSHSGIDEIGFIELECEICTRSTGKRMEGLTFFVCMFDRRRSYISKC